MTPPLRLRSLLFAPAVRPDLVAKLPGTGADGVVIDCEDATPPGAKADDKRLKPDDIWHLIDYVRSLPYESASQPSPAALNRRERH